MFDIAPSELLIVTLVAVVLIGPKDLPRVMTVVGRWVAKARAMMGHFRGAVDDMMREAEVLETARKRQADEARRASEDPDRGAEIKQPSTAVPARAEEPVLAIAQGRSQ